MSTLSRLQQARPTDRYLRWRLDSAPDHVAVDGDHVAWLRTPDYGAPPTEIWATALGDDPVRIARLVDELANEVPVDGLTVGEHVWAELPDHLRGPDHGHWSLWMLDPLDVPSTPTRATVLAPDDPRIDEVLAHSSSAEVFAGDPRVRRWAGVLEDDALLAVAAEQRRPNDAAHLVSVCTAPAARGRGLAADVCVLLMREAVADGVPIVFLEMYAANEPARRVYERLGFTEVGRYRSGALPAR